MLCSQPHSVHVSVTVVPTSDCHEIKSGIVILLNGFSYKSVILTDGKHFVSTLPDVAFT